MHHVPVAVAADIRHGPHRVPRVECSNCGEEHHPDAASPTVDGLKSQCRVCGSFLRRTTPEEDEKFTEFILWNGSHLERERGQ